MTHRLALTLLLALAAVPTRGADLDAILKDVHAIAAPGLPGTVCVYGRDAFVVADGPTDAKPGGLRQPVIAAARHGKGSVVLFGHDGYFAPAALKDADTTQLLLNLLAWAAPGKDRPYVAVVEMPRLTDYLKSKGVAAVDVTADQWRRQLVDHTITLLPLGIPRDDGDAALVRRAVDAGGAVFLAGTGWGYLQTHPGKTLADNPTNRLLASMNVGLALADGTIEKDKKTGFVALSPEPSPMLSAPAALDLLVSSPTATPQLLREKKSDLAQAADTIMHAARALPADADLLKRLSALSDQNVALPTPAKPLRQTDGLARVLLALQLRDLADLAPERVKAHPAAREFPGEVPANAPRVTRTLAIDPAVPRWHSTGLYAAPGEVVSVTIPPAAASLKLRLRIGPHTDRTYHLPSWHRAPEISRAFKLDQAATRVASPFGGLIYVDVPDNAGAAAPFDVTIANTVPAPLFVLGKTPPDEWRKSIRSAPAPWAEIATGKLILTMPSKAVRDVDDPTAVLEHWDRVMDATATLAAWPLARKSPERIVADADISAGYMHSGYPIMTGLDVTSAMVDVNKLRTVNGGWGFYHEIGHNHQNPDWTFPGTTEVTVNLFTMHTLETVCGVSKEDATRRALVEPAARIKAYLAHPDFEVWKSDPFLALAMYAQLRLAFGWEPYKKVFADYRALGPGQHPRTELDKHDQWMTRVSNAVGRNLGPFFQAWGIPTSEQARKSIERLPAWMPADMR